MLLPALNRAKDSAKAVSCINNLKQNGIAFMNYALDFNDQVFTNGDGDTTGQGEYEDMDAWNICLAKYNYLDTDVGGINSCPSVDRTGTNSREAYAVRSTFPSGRIKRYKNGTAAYFFLRIRKVKTPSTAMLLADGFWPAINRQHCMFRYGDSGTTGTYIDMRHSNKANQLYLDSHVKADHDDGIVNAALSDGDNVKISTSSASDPPSESARPEVFVYKEDVATQIY